MLVFGERKEVNTYSALRKVFRARLLQFAREHPEENDIPEETLPHPFGLAKPITSTGSNKLAPSIPTGSSPVANPGETLTKVSHFSASFQRRFSARTPRSDESKTPLTSLNDAATDADSLVSFSKTLYSSPNKRPLVLPHQQAVEDSKILASEIVFSESTPVKDVPSSARLTTTTPELRMPKRSRQSTIDDDDTPQKVIVKRATRTKLFPTPRKNVQSDGAEKLSENSPAEDDVLGFLPESLLQDIREKEKRAMEERDADVAEARSRKKMIAGLPQLFDSMLLIFQSENRSVITKQELVHKILSCNCGVVDRDEVEEELDLMEELIPDWIFKKASATGDILYRLNKMSSSHEIRQRLAAAE